MNQEPRKTGNQSSKALHKSSSRVPGVLMVTWCGLFASSPVFAGDAVAIGYNAEGIWTAVTYYNSSTPLGGKDYKNVVDARKEALRDLRVRAGQGLARASILGSSDSTGFAAVARGKTRAGKDLNVVGYGASQNDADEKALSKLQQAGATENQKIVYRYFSYGADSAADRKIDRQN
jgi:hypothetical protein